MLRVYVYMCTCVLDGVKNTCVGISFLIKFYRRDSKIGVFCKICEVFKSTYFDEHLRTAASEKFMKMCIRAFISFLWHWKVIWKNVDPVFYVEIWFFLKNNL